MKNIQDIKNDLSVLNNYEVVLFGSYASGEADIRSDIDIAIITRENDRKKAMELWTKLLGKAPDNYDLKIFELLPLHIKASLFQNYKVIFGNRVDISEYFYYFRKLWNDMKYRFKDNQFKNIKEKLIALERYKGSKKRTIQL